ncbi:MAG: T9SS type A sorting domain-containing protein [Flavobacterium sp.]|uniref:T9SS type A sorting domain-containing protein n=1 Tax=Flavobacterium sp. TaxID=239 RepID=UPI0022C0656C|nr:T9SS type A sorting domain-containing protein [Flavobacterium sp.]MCZ8197682.1 T9SS type A sorting domain-containing protein [Flavobacterium sp.]
MKKITLFFALVFASLASNAQIAPGSVAPNFTVTDIYGVTHTLYDYTAAGKTVIMDISATWCGPCWNYHNGHALEDMYSAYGPDGSDEIVVLFVEGDGSTPVSALSGTGNTQGNWVAGTPYPIIDSATIANQYQITYFPTVFRICPNNIVTEVGSLSAVNLRNNLNTNCVPLAGVVGSVAVNDNVTNLTCASSTASPTVKVKNYGKNVTGVTTIATVDLKENGTVISTKSTTGTFAQFATKTLTFDPVTFDPSAVYTYEVNNVNSQPNFNPDLSTASLDVNFPASSELDIIVNVFTDNYPTEMSWRIKNSTGTVVATGGPYVGNANGGGADANTTKVHNVTLPSLNECYSVELVDSYGDGWTTGGMEIFNGNTSIWSISPSFTTLLVNTDVLRTGTLATDGFSKSSVSVYPNPSTGRLQIKADSAVSVELVDVLGKVVFTSKNVNNDTVLDLSSLNKGIYLAKITGENINYTEKVILN